MHESTVTSKRQDFIASAALYSLINGVGEFFVYGNHAKWHSADSSVHPEICKLSGVITPRLPEVSKRAH